MAPPCLAVSPAVVSRRGLEEPANTSSAPMASAIREHHVTNTQAQLRLRRTSKRVAVRCRDGT